MCPPSNGIIGIRLAKPSKKLIQANQNKNVNNIIRPEVPIIDAITPSPAVSIACSLRFITWPSPAIGTPSIRSGIIAVIITAPRILSSFTAFNIDPYLLTPASPSLRPLTPRKGIFESGPTPTSSR